MGNVKDIRGISSRYNDHENGVDGDERWHDGFIKSDGSYDHERHEKESGWNHLRSTQVTDPSSRKAEWDKLLPHHKWILQASLRLSTKTEPCTRSPLTSHIRG